MAESNLKSLKYWLVILSVIVAINLLVAVWPLFRVSVVGVGAIGNQLAESYDPYIQYNGGFKTALPIYTTDTLRSDATTTISAGGLVVGGVNIFPKNVSQNNSSTTICSFSNPFGSPSTSTLLRLVVNNLSATSVAQLLEVGTSTQNINGTTTTWFSRLIPANTSPTFVFDFNIASSSYRAVPNAWLGDPVLAPLDKLNVNLGGTVGARNGTCSSLQLY
mgnify:CR=1 FL=1